MPAPKAAQADSGLITLFWNAPSRYADIEFPGDGSFSIFTRERAGETSLDEVLGPRPLAETVSAASQVMNHMLGGSSGTP